MRTLFILLFLLASASFTAAKTRVACVGDSVTFGAAVDEREKNAYPFVLGRLLGADYQVGNFGWSGTTLLNNGHRPYTKTPQYRDALAMKPDVVIIHLGLNDTDPRNYPRFREQFIPDYLALIDSFRQANPAARVIIARMSPTFHNHKRFKAGTRDWYLLIQREIERVAEIAGCELIDFQEVLYNRIDLLPDALHPNVEGARMLAQRVYSAITGDFGGLALGELYSDNMVLQKSTATVITGRANAGKAVVVELGDKRFRTVADANGKWHIEAPLDKAANGLTLKVASEKITKTYKNVCIGHVFVLSGQSNMSWSVAQSTSPENARPSRNIRLFMMRPNFAEQDSLSGEQLAELNSLQYMRGATWKVAEKAEVDSFSAIGYYFAQMLTDSLPSVAIGLIQTSLGGAPAEAFIERSVLENTPWICDILYDWRNNPMIDAWVRKVFKSSLSGSEYPLQRHYFEPTYLYESRIKPLEGTTVKAVLWYQGESNADNAELHTRLFPAVVQSFRTAFDDPTLPFYFVQLSDCDRPSWAHFRETQRRLAAQIDNCKMVVSMDYGDPKDVHPRRKQPIGERLAQVALENLDL